MRLYCVLTILFSLTAVIILSCQTKNNVEQLVIEGNAIEEHFGEVYTIEDIPRLEIIRALEKYLMALEIDPYNSRARVGAVYCYMLIGSHQEAHNLRNEAIKQGQVDVVTELDKIIDTYGKKTN